MVKVRPEPRPRRMVSLQTAPKLWAAFESALREQHWVIVHENLVFLNSVYEQILSEHSAAHKTRQAGCPTCTAETRIGGKDNSDA